MAATAVAPRIDIERRFFMTMVISMALFVVVGFMPSYFLRPVVTTPISLRVPLTPLVHLHAIVGFVWMAFLIWQAHLISGRQHQRHMRNGLIGAGIALTIVAVGVAVAIDSARGGRQPPGWTPSEFMAIPLGTVVMFGGFVAAALWWRKRPDYHKRLMLIGTTAVLVPAGARMSTLWLQGILPPGPLGGMMITDIFIAALVAYDIKKQGRLHPATLWGSGLMLLSQPARIWLSQTETWNAFAAWLIG